MTMNKRSNVIGLYPKTLILLLSDSRKLSLAVRLKSLEIDFEIGHALGNYALLYFSTVFSGIPFT